MSLVVSSNVVDPLTGDKVEFYRPAGAESARTKLWGTPVIRSRFPMLSQVEFDLHVLPEAFAQFESEARRLASESVAIADELGCGPGGSEHLQRYATACLDAVEFARRYAAESIQYW